MYIEKKSGYENNGPAWIGKVKFSKTSRTVYFNGQAFKYMGRATYTDMETGESYWISRIKKNGQDRHRAGSGKVYIDRTIVKDYLAIIGAKRLNKQQYIPVDIKPTDISSFHEPENQKLRDTH